MKNKQKSNPKKISNKKTERIAWILVAIVFGVAIVAIVISQYTKASKQSSEIAGEVNGNVVYYDEIQMYADENKSVVIDEFSKKYGLEMLGNGFWDTQYDDITPREALYDRAISALVRNKVIQQQAVERKIVAPQNYEEMIGGLQNSNPTEYGPTTMSPAEYNSYLMSSAIDDLKTELLNNELAPTEEQEREAFNSLPDEVKETEFSLKGYLVTWQDDTTNLQEQVQILMTQELGFEESINKLSETIQDLQIEPFEFNSEDVHREDISSIELSEKLIKMETGDMLEVDNEKSLYYITEKEGGELLTYEQAPNLGRNKWINDAFETFINEKVQQAEVNINKDAVKKLQL